MLVFRSDENERGSEKISRDPAEELAKVARDRQAGLVVMGLHGSPLLGPRMGSVTYRMLCLAPTLVLALPPKQLEVARPQELQRVGVSSH